MFDKDKKIIFSGIQPSGDFTIANYFGAIRNWVLLQNDYNSIFCVVDLHAITVPQEPAVLRRRSIECAAMILASGIDPEKSLLFLQSSVSAHSELCWLLNCNSYMGEMARMTQYKEKSVKQGDTIRVGLFDYPVLMAADILLYNTDIVPVGDDQTQHVELARNIAERFNHNYSPTFVVPEGYYGQAGSRVMSLANPEKKMSKSTSNPKSSIFLLDEEKAIRKKIMGAVTERNQHINDSLVAAKEANDALAGIQAAKEQALAEQQAEQIRILNENHELKKQLILEAKEQALAEAEKILADARLKVEKEQAEARAQIKAEVIALSVDIAEKLLQRELSDKNAQNEYIEKLLEDSPRIEA